MLQQHVSELEKSLENARTERDEARGAMATASSERDRIATSYQDLIRERAGYMKAVNERDAAVAHVKLLTVEVERLDLALRASETNISRASGDLAAAVADNAPLLALLNRWHAWAMGSGALDTSLDPLFQDSCAVLAKPHPGAALLERMKRLETVLRNLRCIAVSQGVSEQHGVITDADALLAMKGAEECTDASCDRCRGGHPCH